MKVLKQHNRYKVESSRDSWAIRAWLYSQKLSMSEVARQIGVSSSLVYRTVMGQRHSCRVLKYLIEKGMPQYLLGKDGAIPCLKKS